MVDDPQAAPWPLEIVRGFVNSRDIEGGREHLSSPEAVHKWLRESSVLEESATVRPQEVQVVQETREALRALLWINNGDRPDARAFEVLNRLSALAGFDLRFGPGSEVVLEPRADGVTGAMGRLLAIVADAIKEGSWSRLKACRNESCGWAFYDHARNRSAKWCSMAVCGNRMKARAFRARHIRTES